MAWIQNLKNFERLKDSAEYLRAVYGDPLAYLKVYVEAWNVAYVVFTDKELTLLLYMKEILKAGYIMCIQSAAVALNAICIQQVLSDKTSFLHWTWQFFEMKFKKR